MTEIQSAEEPVSSPPFQISRESLRAQTLQEGRHRRKGTKKNTRLAAGSASTPQTVIKGVCRRSLALSRISERSQ